MNMMAIVRALRFVYSGILSCIVYVLARIQPIYIQYTRNVPTYMYGAWSVT